MNSSSENFFLPWEFQVIGLLFHLLSRAGMILVSNQLLNIQSVYCCLTVGGISLHFKFMVFLCFLPIIGAFFLPLTALWADRSLLVNIFSWESQTYLCKCYQFSYLPLNGSRSQVGIRMQGSSHRADLCIRDQSAALRVTACSTRYTTALAFKFFFISGTFAFMSVEWCI